MPVSRYLPPISWVKVRVMVRVNVRVRVEVTVRVRVPNPNGNWVYVTGGNCPRGVSVVETLFKYTLLS